MKIKLPSRPTLRLSTALFKGSFVHNPVLTQIIGICPIVGAATSFTNALALWIMLGINLAVCEGLTSLILKRIPRWLRMCFYTAISLCLILLSDRFILPLTRDAGAGLGIYFYMLSLNALTVIRCEKFAGRTSFFNSIIDAFAASLGYGVIALTVGTVRELLNYGTLFASENTLPRLPRTSMTFIALIILAFLAAAHKWIMIKFYDGEIRDTFSLNAVFEKPVLRDPGLASDRKVIRDYGENIRGMQGQKEKGGEK